MELLASIKYKYDNKRANLQMKIICWSIVIGLLLTILTRSIIVSMFLFGVVVTQILLFKRQDGMINLLDSENGIFLQREEGGQKEQLEKVVSTKFRWSYNFISSGKGGEAGKNSVTHINFIFTRVEFELLNGTTLTIGRELNQWNSIPENWMYEPLSESIEKSICITSYDLVKLKKIWKSVNFNTTSNKV